MLPDAYELLASWSKSNSGGGGGSAISSMVVMCSALDSRVEANEPCRVKGLSL